MQQGHSHARPARHPCSRNVWRPQPIPGVATSNTAFVGDLGRGPVAVPTRLTPWGEFERIFGGLQAGCETSFALRDYFLSGIRIAFVVREEALPDLSVADADPRHVTRVLAAESQLVTVTAEASADLSGPGAARLSASPRKTP